MKMLILRPEESGAFSEFPRGVSYASCVEPAGNGNYHKELSMKRFLVLLVLAVFMAGTIATAEEAVLIDFSKLTADTELSGLDPQNGATLIDYSDNAGTSFSREEMQMMKTSLAIENWEVNLASSSRTIKNQMFSYTAEAQVRDDSEVFAGQTVMGIRVHFPMESFNSYAVVQPPFEIPAYMDATQLQNDGSLIVPENERLRGRKFDNFGVAKNVGVIKSVDINVRGLNFPHGMSLILEDESNVQHQIFMGNLNFDGWKTLRWVNPNYITDVRNRELRTYALYPKSTPLTKLVGIVIHRDASIEGGDFITYVKDIKVTYDKAVLNLEREIDDEAIWGILSQREASMRKAEIERLGNLQVLRYLEKQKMHQDAQ